MQNRDNKSYYCNCGKMFAGKNCEQSKHWLSIMRENWHKNVSLQNQTVGDKSKPIPVKLITHSHVAV